LTDGRHGSDRQKPAVSRQCRKREDFNKIADGIDNLPIAWQCASLVHACPPAENQLGEMRSSGVRGLPIYCNPAHLIPVPPAKLVTPPNRKAIDFIFIGRLVMTKTGLFAGFMVALASLLSAGSANAQIQHTWVSSTGSGSACTRASPCADFFAAQAATSAGGVISVLDSGDYSTINITKSLTIRAEGVDGGYSSSSLFFPWITIQAGPTDVVTLEGLHLKGAGIALTTGGHLHIVRCVITNDTLTSQSGIAFRPDSASKLSVTDTVISNMGSGTGAGIVINPQSGGAAQVNLERVTVNGNAFGIAADGTNSTGGINMTIADSMIGGNAQDGVVATTPSGGAPIGILITNTKSVNNQFGIRSMGSNVTVRVGDSTITGNVTGLSFSGGGALLTFGTNKVRANSSDGAFSGPVALQ
jgi:hypothetical protein